MEILHPYILMAISVAGVFALTLAWATWRTHG